MRWNYTLDGRMKLDSDRPTEPTSYQLDILKGLQNKTVYQGTVPPEVAYARHKKSRAARIARRKNR